MKSDYTQFVPVRFICVASLGAVLVYAQGTTPKDKASDYPVHAQLPGFEIAAEYLVRSLPVRGGVVNTSDHLVLEVAIYPEAGAQPGVSSGEFTLRVTLGKTLGKKGGESVLTAEAPGMVAASIKYPDWAARPTLEATGSVGDAGVVLGRPPVTGRFPGDPRPAQSRLPPRPKAPEQTNPTGEDPPPDEPVEASVFRAAFPEGVAKGPVSGYLFFAFTGKTKSIRSLELVYRARDGGREATLRLF